MGLPLIAAAADKACEVLGADVWMRRLDVELWDNGYHKYHAL